MPAYFWIHNLYALERNSWKTQSRDKRKIKIQKIENDYLAPDTAEEMITALSLLNGWLGESGFSSWDMSGIDGGSVRLILCRNLEQSKRGQVIIKPLEGIAAYRQMLRFYAIKTIATYLYSRPEMKFAELLELLGPPSPKDRIKDWVNLGGQIVPAFRVDQLRGEIAEGKYQNWDEIHGVYNDWDEEYPLDKCRHAWAVMALLLNTEDAPDAETLKRELAAAQETRRLIDRQIYESRAKDYRNPFKKATFRNTAEMEKVLGKPAENPFIRLVRTESVWFTEMIEKVGERLF
jgi:hypothetical protein